MTMRDELCVVVCDFNGWSQTRLCLEALARSRHRDFNVVVVDHGTTEETARGLAADHPEVQRVSGSAQLWWAGATNLGIRIALAQGARTVVLLNNDCYVTPDTLARLASHSCPRAPAIVAPLQRALHKGHLLTNRATTCFALGFPTLPLPAVAIRPGQRRLLATKLILGGRGALIPSEVFARVGLLNDALLPHYGADHDFFVRCRKAGVALYLALDAIVDIDDTRTTRASNIGRKSIRQFVASLSDERSHRNVRALSTLFRLHYPVPGLHHVGTALNVLRYALSYASRRIAFLARNVFSG